jgi:hypothetical protein
VFPALSITTGGTLPQGTQNVAYAAQLNATGGNGSYVWSVAGGSLPSGWTLSSATGLISAAAGFVQPGTFGFTIGVASGSQNASKAFTVVIAQAVTPVQITSATTLPGGVDGSAYSFQFTATGGQGSYAWSVQSGSSLPTGWNLAASTGVLSAPGAAVSAGTFSFNIAVTDGSSSDSDSVSVTIAASSIAIITAGLPNGVEGTPYAATLDATGGSGIGYDWSLVSGALPTGVAGIPALGQSVGLTGVPSAAGTSTFTVRVTDSQGSFAEKTFSVVIGQQGSSGKDDNGGGESGGGCAASVPVRPLSLLFMAGLIVGAIVLTVRLRRRG